MRSLMLLVIALTASPAAAELAVFVDGRVLKVEDAFLKGDVIVLVLPDSGRIEVPALRIDRVVADEVVVVADPARPALMGCDFDWSDEALPEGTPFADLITTASEAAGLHPRLLASLVRAESAFDPDAVSRVGASGLTQLMPAAAADHEVWDVFDPEENLRGGAAHLRRMLNRFGSLPLALAAYNAGATTVERYEGIPPYRETQEYVARVTGWFCGGG